MYLTIPSHPYTSFLKYEFKGRKTGIRVLDLRGDVKAFGVRKVNLPSGTGTGLDPPEGCAKGTNPPGPTRRKAATVVEGER